MFCDAVVSSVLFDAVDAMVSHTPDSARVVHSLQSPVPGKLSNAEAQILAQIEALVQHPKEGPFGVTNLQWNKEHRARRGKHGKHHEVRYCYVPATRIEDFIAGVQNGSEGTQCVYRETKENHKRPEDAREGARTSLYFSRPVFRKPRFMAHIHIL